MYCICIVCQKNSSKKFRKKPTTQYNTITQYNFVKFKGFLQKLYFVIVLYCVHCVVQQQPKNLPRVRILKIREQQIMHQFCGLKTLVKILFNICTQIYFILLLSGILVYNYQVMTFICRTMLVLVQMPQSLIIFTKPESPRFT